MIISVKIKTKKCEFEVLDVTDRFPKIKEWYKLKLNHFYKISEITEDQASVFVDQSSHTNLFAHYVKDVEVNAYCYKSAIDSLKSLLLSKDIEVNDNTYILSV